MWRVYEFRLHSRSALPQSWAPASPMEMGTQVELVDIRRGTEIPFEVLLERLSYAREWLQNSAHGFTLQLTGSLPQTLPTNRRISLRPWTPPMKNWLVEAKGSSSQELTIFDPTTKESVTIPAAIGVGEPIEFDFRVVGRNNDGQMQNLNKPALLLEICGALPMPPIWKAYRAPGHSHCLLSWAWNTRLQLALSVMLSAGMAASTPWL